MDLIGIQIRITIGNLLNDNLVEVKLRNEDKTKNIPTSELIEYIESLLKEKQ